MFELGRKAIPGIVGIFCFFAVVVLFTDSKQNSDSVEWEIAETSGFSEVVQGTDDSSSLKAVAVVSGNSMVSSDDVFSSGDIRAAGKNSDSKKSTAFAKVEENSWVRKAVSDLAASELPDLESDLAKNKSVTRYELAVVVARVIEKFQSKLNENSANVKQPEVAVLSKLSVEFRKELDILGVSSRRFNARLSKVEQKVGSLDRNVRALTRQIASVELKNKERTVASVSQSVVSAPVQSDSMVTKEIEFLHDVIAQQKKDMETGDKQLKHLGNIVSKLLVKVALNDVRLKTVTPESSRKEKRDLGTIARAISGLQQKVKGISGENAVQDQRVDAISRKLASVNTGQVPEKALSEVKGLLKDFFTSYETRLMTVERKAL